MLISKTWLKKYVPAIETISDEQIASKLTSTLAEVESVTKVGEELNRLVAGKVESVEKHPNADKLNVCQVDVGFSKLQIVCGAPNVKAGEMVVVCLEGGSVINSKTGEPFAIKRAKIRDIESQGMICSEKELGISDEHQGILILTGNYKPGDEIDALLKDSIFEIENKSLTHRGDCFSHLGIAREIAAIFDLDFLEPGKPQDPIQTETRPLEISIETDNCQQFTAITMTNVAVEPSPFWLKNVLKNIGVRPVNNVVDISNYVMHDLGQPVHIYDYKTIYDNKLIARQARKGETLSAINNETYTLTDEDIVITDNREIQGLAGIMGGKRSEVTENTTDIIIEVAEFTGSTILKSSRHHGLTTDASVRFSKGVDPDYVETVLKVVTHLVGDLAHGEVSSEILKVGVDPKPEKEIELNLQDVKRVSGESIETETILIYLERLGLTVNNRQQIKTTDNFITAPRIINVTVPRRRRDLKEAVDLTEEIVRLYGYDKITPVYPVHDLKANFINPVTKINRRLRKLMLRLGFEELQNYSVISNETKDLMHLKDRQLLRITNAISPELNYLRSSLIPTLVEAFRKNSSHFDRFKVFELGRIIDNYEYTEEKIPNQPWHIGIMWAEKGTAESIKNGENFKRMKTVLVELLKGLGAKEDEIIWQGYKSQDNLALEDSLHPYRRSTLVVNGIVMGIIAEISPLISSKFADTNTRLVISELNTNALISFTEGNTFQYKEIDRQPQQIRDLSFWLKPGASLGQMVNDLRTEINAADPELEIVSISIIDEYSEGDKQSMTLRLVLQPKQSKFTKEQVNAIIDPIAQKISKHYKLGLRDN